MDKSDHSDYWIKMRQEVIVNPDKKYIGPYAIAGVGETELLDKENDVLRPYRLEVLRVVCEYMDRINVCYWILDGTLLGF